MKLYTRKGDDGSTGLFGGKRVFKDDLRVEAYGSVDELNSTIGLCIVAAAEHAMAKTLLTIQSRLFEIGADLATPADATSSVPRIDDTHIAEMESWIDEACAGLPEMQHFILPGGSELASRLHLSRTVCRRAERRCVTLADTDDVSPAIVTYLNRLSDLLFALARRANHDAGVPDIPWLGRD